MLQQTQVSTVVPYYIAWMERFPTIEALARSTEQDALAMWQGLGYYKRCRQLRQGAISVAQSGMPSSAEMWRKVPGVGEYTAAAISSIAFSEPVPVVDGNVRRVYSRYSGDRSCGTRLHRAALAWAADELRSTGPGEWNQALMELGATVCKPVAPDCAACPLGSTCEARLRGLQGELPTPAAPAKPLRLAHSAWVLLAGDRLGVRRIPPGRWWEGMWEFPRAEKGRECEPAALADLLRSLPVERLGVVRHSVTNHRIELTAYAAHIPDSSPELRWGMPGEISALPMPSPQRKVLQLALLHFGLAE